MGTGQGGTYLFPEHIPGTASAAMRTPFGTLLPAHRRVAAYVRSGGWVDSDPPELEGKILTDINSALAEAKSGYTDTVIILPGHTENVDGADDWSNLVAGTQIIGLGAGTERPTFTWSTATSTVLFDVANVSLHNCILEMEGGGAGTALTVAAPITVSAAECEIRDCEIKFGHDADEIVTVGITTTAAADGFRFINNFCYGATAAECTTFMDIIGVDRLRMVNNYIAGATSNVAVGIVRFATTASTDIYLAYNTYINRKALSTCAVTGLANVSGVSIHEHFAYLDTSSLTPWLTSTGIMTFHRPTVTNTASETGTEVVGTVSA